MAYTKDQLVTAYTNANLGKGPDLATTLTLDAYATQSQTGGITDTVALTNTLKLVNSTTAVAIEAYQFFTNRAPSAAGLAYLVNSTTNANDLNDAYFAKFSQENRFINFSINLATGTGEGAAAFKAAYGDTATATVTYAQAVAAAYDKIIGNAVATAAGVDVAGAVAYLTRQANIDYLTAFVKANTGYTAEADINLAVKAALIGEVLNVATVNGLGGYANATTAMINDLSDGTLSTDNAAGVNILTNYPTSGGLVGSTYNLTVGVDPIVGTGNNDTINGTTTAAANNVTLLDSIDGGAGVDVLNLADSVGATLATSLLTVKNVETLNLTSVTGLNAGAVDTSTWTGLQTANIVLAAPAAGQTVTAAGTTAVNLTAASVAANALSVQGGSNVTVTATGETTGTIDVGSTTQASGAVTISTTGSYADGANTAMGAITVKGGTSVTVTEATGITAANTTAALTDGTNFAVNQSAVTVTGTSATTAVTVNQAAAVTGVNGAVENTVFTFGTALTAGQTVTIAGLTYTSTGATSTAQLAAAFANLANGATTGGGGATGTYSGTFTGWTSGAAAGSAVTVSSTSTGNVTDLTSADPNGSLVGGSAVVTQGVAGKIGVNAGAVTINDVNASSTSAAGKIASVTLGNGTSTTINSNALTSLTLNGSSGVVINALTTNPTTSKALTLNLSGGTTNAVTDTNAEITALTVNATAAATLASFADANLTTLTVSGSKLLTIAGVSGMTGLKTITVTGAGGFTNTTANAITTLTKIDTSGATGATTVSIDATKMVSYVGGAGVDSVTLVGALITGSSIVLGAGNDRLLQGAAGAVTTSATTVVDGGEGVDSVASGLISVGNASMFKNFEIVNLSNTGGTTFDVALLTGSTVQSLELNGGTGVGNYASVTTAQTLAVTGAAAGSDATLGFTGVTGTADAYSISFNATTTGTATSPTTVDAGIVRFAGIETVNVASGSAAGVNLNKIVLNDADARSLVVTGSQGADIAFNTAFGTAGANGLSLIDASATSGGVKIATLNAGIATAGLAIKGGSGADNIIVADHGVNAAITVTTGGGKDTVDVGANLGIIGSGATAAAHTTITDFASGDALALKNQGTEVFTSTKFDVSTFGSLAAILDAVAAGDGSTNGIVKWFQYNGATYVVEDNSAANTIQATDVVVKLTGLVDFSTAAGAGTHTLTLA